MEEKVNSAEVFKLSTLLQIQERAREAENIQELGFVAANETRALVSFRQAIVWNARKGVSTLSGVAILEKDAPYIQWLQKFLARFCANLSETQGIKVSDLSKKDAAGWAQWLPPEAIILPLETRNGKLLGAILFVREAAWTQGEVNLLEYVAKTVQHAWEALGGKPRGNISIVTSLMRKFLFVVFLAAVGIVLSLPIPLTVLAPAEIVPVKPEIVRAPLDGVMDQIFVTSNQKIAPGTPLFSLDATTITNKLLIAKNALLTTQAVHRQTTLRAVGDLKAKARLTILEGKITEHQAEIEYLSTILKRVHMVSDKSGMIILDDATAWSGRPVSLGEKILMIADETNVEIEAWLSVGDAIRLVQGAPVTVFLDANPLEPLKAELDYLAYEATARPDGSLAYRIRASLAEMPNGTLVGLRGMARISGQDVSLAYWLFRRPIAIIRGTFGI